MRLAILTSMALLLSAGCALAQATTNTMTSGRPSAVLDDATCQTIWQKASPNGAALTKDQAVPYIVNFSMVEANHRVESAGSKPSASASRSVPRPVLNDDSSVPFNE